MMAGSTMWRSKVHWAVAAIGIALSALAFAVGRDSDEARVRRECEFRAEWLARSLEHAIAEASNSITAMAVYVAADLPPQPERFKRLAEQARAFGAPVQRIVWQPRIADAERTAFESSRRAQGYDAFQVLDVDGEGRLAPAARRAEYFPIATGVEFTGFPSRAGLDTAGLPGRRAIMDSARDTGRAVAGVQPLRTRENQGTQGYSTYWPIYRGGGVPATTEERQDRLAGYVTGIFALSDVLDFGLRGMPERIETIRFLPGSRQAEAREPAAASYLPTADHTIVGAPTKPERGAGLRVERRFTVNDLAWRVTFDYDPALLSQRRSLAPWSYLALGLMLTGLLTRHQFAARRALDASEDDRRRTRAILDDTERRSRDFAEIASDWMWEVDQDGKFTYFSETAIERVGGDLPPLGSAVSELPVSDPHAPGWVQLQADFAARRSFRNLVYGRCLADGTVRHIRVSGTPIFHDTEFRGYRGVTSDVTVEVENQRRLVDAIEAMPAGLMLFDRDERLIIANTLVRDIFRDGQLHLEPGVYFETMARAVAERQVPGDAAGRADAWVRDRMVRFRGGNSDVIQPFTDGRIQQVIERQTSDGGKLIIYVDVTALKESEQRLRVTLEAVPSGLMVVAQDGTIVMVNAQLEALVGYSRAQLIGASMDILVPERYRHAHGGFRDIYMQGPRARPMGAGRDLHARRPDGSEFPVEIGLNPFRSAEGAFVIASIVDITERRRMEETLNQAQKMEVVGQLTGGVAHDFNNLLSVIVGNLELMSEANPDETSQRRLRTVLRAANRGAELTHRLLAFSRRQSLQPAATAIPTVFDDLQKLLARTLGETIEVDTRTEPGLAACMVDRGQLENAILNLAINARDAMPRGGRITVAARNAKLGAGDLAAHPDAMPGTYVAVSVTDEGAGMTEEVRQRAFEPFFTTKEVGKGSGLGLSMVYGFVRQSGGHVTLDSAQGVGTTVTLFLPRAVQSVQEESEPPRRVDHLHRAGTVLVVEDQADVREITVARFESMGFDVLQAESGQAGLATLKAHGDIRLLFSDVVMPGGMDGIALARAAHDLRPDLAVLLTSGYIRDPAAKLAASGFDERILQKPYRSQDLATAVDTVLARRARRT